MSPVAVGLALAAGLIYAGGTVIEHHVAQEQQPELALRPGLLAALLRRPLWVFAVLAGLVAYGLEAAALAIGSVIAVAPLLVSGLLFALPLSARHSHRPMTRVDWTAAITLTGALAVFVTVGRPHGDRSDTSAGGWVAAIAIIAAIVAILVIAAIASSPADRSERRALELGTATGTLYGLTTVLTKATTSLLGDGVLSTLGHWQPYALAAAAAVAFLLNQSAFQAGHLGASLPAISVVNPIVASVLGATLFGERLGTRGPAAAVAVVASALAMLWATLALARSTESI